jgi:flotillin
LEGFNFAALALVAFLALIVMTLVFLASRYKRCPSDKILVIYGKVGEGQSSNCIHGGGTLVWPLIQDCAYLTLRPMSISIPLQTPCPCKISASTSLAPLR